MGGDAAGETGARWPIIIWNAGIIINRPATIEMPGVIATTADKNIIMPNARL
jgi:filamentous hemagglutinin family protein